MIFDNLDVGFSVFIHKCQKKGKTTIPKNLPSNEIFINKKVKKWIFMSNNEKILLNLSTTGQNFRLFQPKTKKISFKQLFLMPFFEAKY